jgi:hypothetical protein
MRSPNVRSKVIMERTAIVLKRLEILAFGITIIASFNVNK